MMKPDPARYEEFVERYSQHHGRLLAYVFRLLPHRQDAEDVLQRTSIALWRKYAQFDPSGDFLAWACTVAHFEVRNFLRTAARDRLRFGDALIEQLASEELPGATPAFNPSGPGAASSVHR